MESHSELPLLVQRPMVGCHRGAVLPLLTPAAALFDGDVVDLTVDCGPATDVTLVTVGATRLNRCDRGMIEVHLAVRVAAGAVFRYLPHELIPFRGAAYRQRNTIDLEGDGSALLLEVITPGHSFSYRQLEFETRVRTDGSMVALERFVLTGESRVALGGRTHYGSLLLLGREPDAAAADARLAQSGVYGSASKLPRNGIVLKALGDSAQQLRDALLSAIRWQV